MTRIHVDAEALAIRGPGALTLDPAAIKALRFLVDAGHEVVVVASEPEALPEEIHSVAAEVVTGVPSQPSARAWYLTTAVERCLGLSARIRTVLIGASPPPGSIHRCDAVSRDLRAAALEILASEAMPAR